MGCLSNSSIWRQLIYDSRVEYSDVRDWHHQDRRLGPPPASSTAVPEANSVIFDDPQFANRASAF
jgi:hypothetical protein